MKKFILSLLLLCSIATYADIYYTNATGIWDPSSQEWVLVNRDVIKVSLTDNYLIIFDTPKNLTFLITYISKPKYTDDGLLYFECIARQNKYVFDICFRQVNKYEMDIIIFKHNTSEGLIYRCNL